MTSLEAEVKHISKKMKRKVGDKPDLFKINRYEPRNGVGSVDEYYRQILAPFLPPRAPAIHTNFITKTWNQN